MRPEQLRIQANAADPFLHQTRVLACGHKTPAVSPAREQKIAGLLAWRSQVVFDGLPGLFTQLELDRLSRFPLSNRRALHRVAIWWCSEANLAAVPAGASPASRGVQSML